MIARRKKTRLHDIAPDEIFLDSSNLPAHEKSQFEGRVVRPLPRRTIVSVGAVFALIVFAFAVRALTLQIVDGAAFADISRQNTLESSIVFAARGVITDRNGKELAWNEPQTQTDSATSTFALRKYIDLPGFSHLLGFVQYPEVDSHGQWWRSEYTPISGVELSFNSLLAGQNGSTMVEKDAHGSVERENIVAPPEDGAEVALSIDADLQTKLYSVLSAHAQEGHFTGGAAIIMDVRTGQILALTSFPQYDDNAFTAGDIAAVRAASNDPSSPLLDRSISGLYAPGSIVKPIFAAAALNEDIISPDKQIDSVGQLTIPNPYDPAHPSIFRDWTVHGWIDMRTAIAVSSDEYFYTIGGGYGDQPGLGITRIDEYAARFGLGSKTGIALAGEQTGVVPSPAWKAIVFPDDPTWRLGDTYHTAIGQYGFQITPIQAVRYVAAIANGGKLLTPQLLASSTPQFTSLGIPDTDLEVVREGMRLGVTSNRTDAIEKFFNIPGIAIAGKTGTAQIGAHNQWVNSWAVGFWPANDPKYAYVVVLEQGPAGETSGAAPGLLPFFQWLVANHPEYLQ
jgi:penicillin-binding protein 2